MGFLGRAKRAMHHVVFHASREGRAAEIVGWSNVVASLVLGGAIFARTRHAGLSVAVAVVALLLLRLALANRVTVRIAAVLGTVAVAAMGGGASWVLAHVLESVPSAPIVAAVIGTALSAVMPVWAYGRIAHLREHTRDSLIDPVSVPSSRG
jgi:hypothetical protein